MSSQLYAPDLAVQDLLTLNNFEDNFDILEFVSAISDKLITQSKEDSGPFDPAPFIRTFEHSVDTLLEVRKDVQTKKEALESSLRASERDFTRRLNDLNSGFEAVNKSFGNMEGKIGQVGKSAVRVGEQLESIHVSRQRAQAAHDLIDYYNQFSKGDTEGLDALRKDGGKAGRRQVAIILRRLTTVAREVDLPDADQTRGQIEKYCEQFEKDMLRLFDKSYRKGDPNMMGHCAQTLIDFNGGASCVQIYVNQHDFFMSKSQMADLSQIENSDIWTSLPDLGVPVPTKEPGLTNLFDEIRYTVEQEYRIIQAVFPNPPYVMQVFLQRVFAQSIQQYLEQLLNKAQVQSTLSYLRVLQIAHVQVSKLVEDLKTYDFSSALTTRPTSEISPEGSNAATVSNPTVAIGTMLENAMEELFVPYNEGAKYIDKECKTLQELYAVYLERFTKYHEPAVKSKSIKLFDRLAQLTGGPTTAAGAAAAAQGAATAAFMNISGRIRAGVGSAGASAVPPPPEKDSKSTLAEAPTEEDGRLSIDVAEKVLSWHAEAVGRCVELSAQSDLPKHIFALMKVLTDEIGKGYVETAMDSALAVLEARDAKLEPDLQPIRSLKDADMICHLWQQYTNVALLPLANTSVTVRREMSMYNKQTLSRIEGGANNMLQRVADAIVAWLAAQLAKQKRNDFKPRNDDLSFARVNTEPCEACCDLLEQVRDIAKESLSGKNLEAFLTSIGVTFHTMLLDHFKKFPVSANGGLMLTKDLKTYQDTIVSFGLPALSERFEFLRQLGNVFLIQPDTLKSYITENYLGRIEPILLRPYLAQRSDWAQFESAFDFGTNAVDGAGDPGASNTASFEALTSISGLGSRTLGMGVGSVAQFRDRLQAVNVGNRLSTMMRDLETTRLGGASGFGLGENRVGLGFQALNASAASGTANIGTHSNGYGNAGSPIP